jgi:hypothetical protein
MSSPWFVDPLQAILGIIRAVQKTKNMDFLEPSKKLT